MVWHVGFGNLLRRRGPPSFEVHDEVPLSDEPARMDFLVLRKLGASAEGAETLRRLWPLLPRITIVEYKSPGRPYRTGDLDRLWSYAHAYHAAPDSRPPRRSDLCAVLAVPRRTPSLNDDVESMGVRWEDLGGGYWRALGGHFALVVLELGAVAETEGDGVLQSLGEGRLDSLEARRFWTEIVGSQEAGMSMQDLEGFDELTDKLLTKLPPERRLAGLAPEQRLAGLDRDHEALALSVELLRVLPESYIRSLPLDVQEEIAKRLGRASP